MFYWVNQGKTYKEEREGGYLWAPKSNDKGNTMFHWETMRQLDKQHIVFNYCKGYVVGYCVVKGPCFTASQPEEFCVDVEWQMNGYMVKADYKIFHIPLDLETVYARIKMYLPKKYAPLNDSGVKVKANQGYLYKCNKEIAIEIFKLAGIEMDSINFNISNSSKQTVDKSKVTFSFDKNTTISKNIKSPLSFNNNSKSFKGKFNTITSDIDFSKYSIYELYSNKYVSQDLLNVCYQNRLKDINDIFSYYDEFGDFRNLKSCDGKSNNELLEIVKKHHVNSLSFKKKDTLFTLFTRLDFEKRQIVNSYLNQEYAQLSNSLKRKLSLFLKKDISFESFYSAKFFSTNFDFPSFRNFGSKSINELNMYITSLKSFIEEVSKIASEEQLEAHELDSYFDDSNEIVNNDFEERTEERAIKNNKHDDLQELYMTFTYEKKEIANSYINIEYSKLSNRLKNRLTPLLNRNISFDSFFETEFFSKDIDVYSIRNLGKKSINELKEFLELLKSFLLKFHYMSYEEVLQINDSYLYDNEYSKIETENNNEYLDEFYLKKSEDSFQEFYTCFTDKKKQIANSFLKYEFSILSNRLKNVLSTFLNASFDFESMIASNIFSPDFDVYLLRNLGVKSAAELKSYIELLKSFIVELHQIESEDKLVTLHAKFTIKNNISEDIDTLALEGKTFFQKVSYLLDNNILFKEKETKILKKCFKIYSNSKEIKLNEIADELSLSRERVRQITSNLSKRFLYGLKPLRNFNFDTNSFQIDINSDILTLSESSYKLINVGDLNFSYEFTQLILYDLFKEDYQLVGVIDDVLSMNFHHNRGKKFKWYNFYIVKNQLLEKIDLDALVVDVHSKRLSKIEETYSFHIKSYISRFLVSSDDTDAIEDLLPFVEDVLDKEFDILVDVNDEIVFERNTKMLAHEYSRNALLDLGEPSGLTDIFKKIKELYPNFETTENKVRTTMKRVHGFVPIGKRSFYGLKEWETTMDSFKGGSIREIVKKYLRNFEAPKSTNEIVVHVLNYRPESNERSIVHNLKLDTSKDFIFYKNSLIGLTEKKYEASQLDFQIIGQVKQLSWSEKFQNLIDFTSLHGKLPKYSQTNPEESSLYRWIKRQKDKIIANELEEHSKIKFIEFLKNNDSDFKINSEQNSFSDTHDLGENSIVMNIDESFSDLEQSHIINTNDAFVNTKPFHKRNFLEEEVAVATAQTTTETANSFDEKSSNDGKENNEVFEEIKVNISDVRLSFKDNIRNKHLLESFENTPTIDSLLEFVIIQGKEPNKNDYKNLFALHTKIKTDFIYDKLSEPDKTKFLQIAKLIKNR